MSERTSLGTVLELTATAKRIEDSAFRLRLLGFNAGVLSRRVGDEARGFGVLSNEWVGVGLELHEVVQRMSNLREALVVKTTRALIVAHRHKLLRVALANRPTELHRATALVRANTEATKALNAVVDDAMRLCRFGQTIVRMAKVEAAWADASRRVLLQLANDFEVTVAEVLPMLVTMRRQNRALEAA